MNKFLLFLFISFFSISATTAQAQFVASVLESETFTKNYTQFSKRKLLKLVSEGDAEAQYQLGLMYEKGQGVEQDYKEAVKRYKQAAKSGHTQAQFNLAQIHYSIYKNHAEAIKGYTKAAYAGNAEAQFKLGLMHEFGQGVEQDYSKSYEWYRRAAKQKHAASMYRIGVAYENGQGVQQYYLNAQLHYERAAEAGNVDAQLKLGQMYAEGNEDVKKDIEKSIKWYTQAASNKSVTAHFQLGLMYAEGKDVKKDIGKSIKWFKPAAEAGNTEAQFNLGEIYYAIYSDYQEAFKWFSLANKKGNHAKAKIRLKGLYTQGYGIEKNQVKSIEQVCRFFFGG